jgi:sortase (surface protein transpeptidase)
MQNGAKCLSLINVEDNAFCSINSVATMKKLLFFIVIFGIGVGLATGFLFNRPHDQKRIEILSAQTTPKQTKDLPSPTEKLDAVTAPGLPQTIRIPKINVDAKIESVGMDSRGRMDVPQDSDNTAWFSPGYRPGKNGSAVIDGHKDNADGSPSVFWDLTKLAPGDTIIVTDDAGHEFTFAVDRLEKYPDATFPIKEVFAAADVPQLNLITCNGTWDKNAKNYSDRLVVYSTLIAQK